MMSPMRLVYSQKCGDDVRLCVAREAMKHRPSTETFPQAISSVNQPIEFKGNVNCADLGVWSRFPWGPASHDCPDCCIDAVGAVVTRSS